MTGLRSSRWIRWSACLSGIVAAFQTTSAATNAPAIHFETFGHITLPGGILQLASATRTNAIPTNSPALSAPTGVVTVTPSFRAVRPTGWFKGLVAIYTVERENRTELRRLPGRGQENLSDPYFMLLPNADEPPEVVQISGLWEISALQSDKSPATFSWEIASDGSGQIAGRFEQLTDYRFAHLVPGKFRNGQVELGVEYINQRFKVKGTWSPGHLKGTWEELDSTDGGTWQAKHTMQEGPRWEDHALAPLWEWTRDKDGARHYGLEPGPQGPGWTRSQRPLGRVWRLVLSPK